MALFLEFVAQQWLLVAALLTVIVMLVLHESRKSGASVTPQQAINEVNGEGGYRRVPIDDGSDRFAISMNYKFV